MDWKNKSVLVTGAGGFIGSHLAEKLVARGARTRALVHYNSTSSWGWLSESPCKSDIEVFLGDIRDPTSLNSAMKNVDIVFHLAALIAIPYSYETPISYIRTNVEGTLNILEAAREKNVGLVLQTSTSEVYGTARYVPIDEKHPLQGQSPYAASKIGADKIAESFYLSFGLPVVVVRPFNTFGPRQSARAVIPAIITQSLKNKKINLGNLQASRDLNYVDNTIDGFLYAAETPGAVGQVIHFGSGKEISISDLVFTIARLMNKEIEIEVQDERLRPSHSEVNRLIADSSLAQGLLSWKPTVSLEEGLSRTIEWIRQNLGKYRPDIYAV